MRLTIDRKTERKGIIKKTETYVVDVTVEWTEEELAIVKQRKLEEMVLCDHPHSKAYAKLEDEIGPVPVRIMSFLPDKKKSSVGNHAYKLDKPIDADNWEKKVTEHIKEMKDYIMANADAEEGSKTIEL